MTAEVRYYCEQEGWKREPLTRSAVKPIKALLPLLSSLRAARMVIFLRTSSLLLPRARTHLSRSPTILAAWASGTALVRETRPLSSSRALLTSAAKVPRVLWTYPLAQVRTAEGTGLRVTLRTMAQISSEVGWTFEAREWRSFHKIWDCGNEMK